MLSETKSRFAGKKIVLIFVLLALQSVLLLAQQTREEKLAQLRKREDIKVTEVEQNILKIEFPNGKTILKNIGNYEPRTTNKINYSPTFDSTIIDLRTIDTTLYYQKYSFWQEVPLGNFRTLLVGDINNNNLPELYGQMKDYTTDYTDIVIFKMNQQGTFDSVYSYDTTVIAKTIYDIDKDGNEELHLIRNLDSLYPGNSYRFYKKRSPSSLADSLIFIFYPFGIIHQQNDNYFGDWDGDELTDQIFISINFPPSVNIFEYAPLLPNFDSVYQFDYSPLDLYYGGFSIGDFDQDGKTEFLAGSVHGKVLSIENSGNNSYQPNWQGTVETFNAYLCTETNDIDGNGKKEIWIGGDAFYSGVGITRITIFEANGNDNYEAVGRIDLVGVFSFDAGNVQVLDVDKDGKEEILFGLDETVIILKFNGSVNHQTYEVFYFKQNDWENNYIGYYGANLYDLTGDGKYEMLINCWDDPPGLGTIKWFNWIYKPNYAVNVETDENTLLDDYKIYPVYPNPFNPETKIKFDIVKTSNVSIKVYNILGKEITTLLEKELTPGSYTISWEARDSNGMLLPSGVYLIRFTADNYTKTVKALLLK